MDYYGEILPGISALIAASTRRDAARKLARALGAADLVLFVRDSSTARLLPIGGLPQTLPQGARWHQFLDLCLHHRDATEVLAYPGFDQPVRVVGMAEDDHAVLALLGGSPNPAAVAQIRLLLPLLGAAFIGEQLAAAATSHAAAAREAAAKTQLLADRLDLVRRDLQTALVSAENANSAKDHFLAVLSHELRTPLMPVLATVAMLERQPEIPPELRADIARIRRNVELEARLIDDLLDLTRLSRGKVELHKETLDIHELAEQAVEIVRGDLDDKQIHLELRLEATRVFVRGDPARLQQVLWNLLKNAIKFTPPNGRIALHTFDQRGKVGLRVSDSGIGIPADVLPRIFDAFEQASRSVTRQFGGLGLGLAIAKTLTDLHRGSLTAHSDGPDTGATFTLILDTVPGPATAASIQATAHRTHHANALGILLVEDNVDTAHVMAKLLRSMGHTVTVAHTFAGAVKTANDQRFDVLVSDIGLPDRSGLELMPALHASHTLMGVALSGYGMESDVKKSLDAGFAHHLTKPISFAALEAILNEVAGRRS